MINTSATETLNPVFNCDTRTHLQTTDMSIHKCQRWCTILTFVTRESCSRYMCITLYII